MPENIITSATVAVSAQQANLTIPSNVSGTFKVRVRSVSNPAVFREMTITVNSQYGISNVRAYAVGDLVNAIAEMTEGQDYVIKWDIAGAGVTTYDLYLVNNSDVEIATLATGVADTVSSTGFTFTYPEDLNEVSVKLKVAANVDNSYHAISPALTVNLTRSFTTLYCVQDTIQTTTINAGAPFTVNWTADDLNGDVTVEVYEEDLT